MFSQQFYFSLSLIMCVEDVGKFSETVSAQLSGNWKPWVSTVQLQLMHSAKQATSKALWSSSLRDPHGDRHRGTAALETDSAEMSRRSGNLEHPEAVDAGAMLPTCSGESFEKTLKSIDASCTLGFCKVSFHKLFF